MYYLQMYDCCFSGSRDCEWSPWTISGSCSKPCGGGEQVSLRSIKVPAANGGKDCGNSFRKTEMCNTQACPIKINCEWQSWTQSGNCSKPCGGGDQLYVRRHLIEAQNGGQPCNGYSHKTQPCNVHTC